MTEAIYRISMEHNAYPNFTVYDRFYNGEASGWKVITNEGYVFYDPSDENIEYDPETLEPISVIHYYTQINFPRNYNWDNFNLIAVPRDSADENYIFGDGNDHEAI